MMRYDSPMKNRVRSPLAAMILLAAFSPLLAQAGGKPLPAVARVRSEVNLFVELHNHLQAASRMAEDSLPEYRTEVKAYRDAKELSKDPAVMRIINSACVTATDIASIAKVATQLPPAMAPADQEAARKMIGALESAWPRFHQQEGIERNRSLQAVWSRVLIKHWGLVQERLLTTLYEKFAFQPLDRQITVYPVLEPVELGASGTTDKGYYTIIPVMKAPNLVIIEELLHEVTHVIDEHQPPGSRSLLIRLREQGSGVDPETLDAFMHGLVSWNAGELIRRFVSADYKPLADLSEETSEPLARFVATYQGPWVGYLEGKIQAEDVIKGMISSLKPAAGAPAAPVPVPKPGS